jgi:diaminopimelate epimerase
MRVQNADGSDAGMCGNGLRCVARFLYEAEAVPEAAAHVDIAAGDGVYRCAPSGPDRFVVAMGVPREVDPSLPPPTEGVDEVVLETGGESVRGTRLSFGNPHLVVFDDAAPRPRAERLGAALERHPAFPQRVNVSFARPVPGGFDVVVWERGVGITRACGSGACAVGAAAVRRRRAAVGEGMRVALPGGVLIITVDPDGAVTMEGEAARVFAGEWPR